MDEDGDDESDIKHDSKISFIWGSSLHRMPAAEPTDVYEVVELSTKECVTEFLSSHLIETDIRDSENGGNITVSDDLPYDRDHGSKSNEGVIVENSFSKFGYDNLPEIDTSDEENNEDIVQPTHDSNILKYLNGNQIKMASNIETTHGGVYREYQCTTGDTEEVSPHKITKLDGRQDTKETIPNQLHMPGRSDCIQKMSHPNYVTPEVPFEHSDSITPEDCIEQSHFISPEVPIEQPVLDFESEKGHDTIIDKSEGTDENGTSKPNSFKQSYQTNSEIKQTHNLEADKRDFSSLNKNLTNQTSEIPLESCHGLKIENKTSEYVPRKQEQTTCEISDTIFASDSEDNVKESIQTIPNKRSDSYAETTIDTYELSYEHNPEGPEDVSNPTTDNSITRKEDLSKNRLNSDEDRQTFRGVLSLKNRNTKDHKLIFSDNNIMEKNENNELDDNFKSKSNMIYKNHNQGNLKSPSEEGQNDYTTPKTPQNNYFHNNDQNSDIEVTSSEKHTPTVNSRSKSYFYCNVKPPQNKTQSVHNILKHGTQKTNISVEKEFDNSLLSFEGFFSSTSTPKKHYPLVNGRERSSQKFSTCKTQNPPTNFGHKISIAENILNNNLQEAIVTSLRKNDDELHGKCDNGLLVEHMSKASSYTEIVKERKPNQFTIRHFGRKNKLGATSEEHLTLTNITSNGIKKGNKRYEDIIHRYRSKCQELEGKRNKSDLHIPSSSSQDMKEDDTSTRSINIKINLRFESYDTPFEVRANQPWNMEYSPTDSPIHYTDQTCHFNNMLQNKSHESEQQIDSMLDYREYYSPLHSPSLDCDDLSSTQSYRSTQLTDIEFQKRSHDYNNWPQKRNKITSDVKRRHQSYTYDPENTTYSEYERHDHGDTYRTYREDHPTEVNRRSYEEDDYPHWDPTSDISHQSENDFPLYTNDNATPYETEPYTSNRGTSRSSSYDKSHNPEHNLPMSPCDHSTPYQSRQYRSHKSTSLNSSIRDCHNPDPHQSYTLKDYLWQLTEYMDEMGFEVKNVSGDGNCLFAAIVDQLRINGEFTYTAESLRKASVKYLRETPHIDDETHLEQFLTNETWEEYLNRMEITGEWGDDIMLRGIAELLGRTIMVYSSYLSVTTLTPTRGDEEGKGKLYIGHIKVMMHFVSLRPKHWEVTWPIKAQLRRMSAIIESKDLNYALTSSKLILLKDALTNKDVTGYSKYLDEIDRMLEVDKESSSLHGELIRHDTLETMAALVYGRFGKDLISGIPMIHFSFLVKILIQPNYFRVKDIEFGNPPIDKDLLCRVGLGALGLDIRLIDLTEAFQNFTLIQSKTQKIEQIPLLTFVVKMPSRSYCIKDISDDMGTPTTENCLLIDDSETMAGYTRLRPINPVLWPGSVKWMSSKDVFIGTLNANKGFEEKSSKQSLLKSKMFEGLECKFWPRQAYKWKERKPASDWPSVETKMTAVENGCLLVLRASHIIDANDLDWQFVFTDAERILVQTFTEDMRYCFQVFKTLVDYLTKSLEVKIKSYWLLTAMFYCSEIIPREAWSVNSGGCIMYLVAWLLTHIKGKDIPNYFIPENNMIKCMPEDSIKLLEQSLDGLRCFPLASLHFLLDSHSFTNLDVIDQLEVSIVDYIKLEEKQKVVENCFVPICFSLAKQNVNHRLISFYNNALYYIDTVFHQIISIDNDEEKPSFVDFVLSFLSSIPDSYPKLSFAQFIDAERKTNFSYLLLKYKSCQSVSDIVGRGYTGKWDNVYVDVTEDKWNSIYTLTGQLFIGGEHQECAEILRCSLQVLQKTLKECKFECVDVSDDVKTQMQEEHSKKLIMILRYLVTFYKHLHICYDQMDQAVLFQEHIHDYEEIVDRIPSHLHYEQLAKIYRRLGNREKAVTLEKKANTNKPSSSEEGGHRVLAIIF